MGILKWSNHLEDEKNRIHGGHLTVTLSFCCQFLEGKNWVFFNHCITPVPVLSAQHST